jgi:hypothetical protein
VLAGGSAPDILLHTLSLAFLMLSKNPDWRPEKRYVKIIAFKTIFTGELNAPMGI